MADDAVRESTPNARMDDHRRALREALLVGAAAGVVIFVSVYGLWGATERTTRQQVRTDMARLASTMSTLVDPLLHQKVRASGEVDTPDYMRAISALRHARRSTPGVKYVYTVVLDGDTARFVLDTAEPGDNDHDGREDRSPVGEAYADPDPEMLEALGTPSKPGHAVASTTPYTDAWGTFISGYAPVFDANRRQIAILGVDVDAKDFLADAEARRGAMLLGLIPAACLVLGLGIGVYRLRRRQLSSVRRMFEERQRVIDAERLAAHQERRTRSIIDGTGVMAWELDLSQNRLTYVSPHGMRLGFRTEDWLAPGFWRTLVHPDDQGAIERFVRGAHATGGSSRTQLRVRTAGGSSQWVELVISAEHDDQRPDVISGILMDVSEARRLREAAEAASRSKSEFLANMSHEIRTPLTAILGYTELLREDGDTESAPVRRLQTIDTIRTAGQYLLSVVSDILDLSKIEAGRMTVETVAVDLPSVLIDCEQLLGSRAAEKKIDFAVTLDAPIPRRAITDPTRLRQIILNLAGNAIKFTEHGHVAVRASVLNAAEPVQRLRIDVEDTGPGLTTEQSSRLFQAFSQGDNSVTRTHGGTGLGLTISRRLARLMGGDVLLHQSTPGAGSTFRIEIDVIPSEGTEYVTALHGAGAGVQPAAPATAPTRLAGRVLVAEDNPVNQRLLEVFLGRRGATVAVAADGAQALARIEEAEREGEPFDLLITDMQMPVMDGYTLVRTLRARGNAVPTIALTANAMAEDRQQCLEAGCDEYAVKPVDLPALLSLCARWIDAQRPPAGLAFAGAHDDSPSTADGFGLRQTA